MFVTSNSRTHLGAVKGKRCLFLQISRESAGQKLKKRTSDRNLSPESEPVLSWPDSTGSVHPYLHKEKSHGQRATERREKRRCPVSQGGRRSIPGTGGDLQVNRMSPLNPVNPQSPLNRVRVNPLSPQRDG